MEFEFDPAKSATNFAKHGIDFTEAAALWDDPFSLGALARSDDEPRFVWIANYQEKLWAAFYTERNGKIRLISVRRAREQEERLYHEGN
jgi:uncharacterized DUF497 family protein